MPAGVRELCFAATKFSGQPKSRLSLGSEGSLGQLRPALSKLRVVEVGLALAYML